MAQSLLVNGDYTSAVDVIDDVSLMNTINVEKTWNFQFLTLASSSTEKALLSLQKLQALAALKDLPKAFEHGVSILKEYQDKGLVPATPFPIISNEACDSAMFTNISQPHFRTTRTLWRTTTTC